MNKRCHCGCEFELLDYHLQQRTDTMLFSQAELDNLCHRCWATKVEKVRRWLHNRVGGVMPTPMREAQAKTT